MTYTIVIDGRDIALGLDIVRARATASNMADELQKVVYLYNDRSELIQTSHPIMMTNEDLDMMAEGYKFLKQSLDKRK